MYVNEMRCPVGEKSGKLGVKSGFSRGNNTLIYYQHYVRYSFINRFIASSLVFSVDLALTTREGIPYDTLEYLTLVYLMTFGGTFGDSYLTIPYLTSPNKASL